tara:strand:+ start:504 stop:746 length:243 start_codon:yes stop_codon:yes gene_type:complete
MGWFNVKVELEQTSVFEIELEADDYYEAQQIVQNGVWNDDYTKDIRTTLEIVDENYEAIEMCEDCNAEMDYCVCEEDEDA